MKREQIHTADFTRQVVQEFRCAIMEFDGFVKAGNNRDAHPDVLAGQGQPAKVVQNLFIPDAGFLPVTGRIHVLYVKQHQIGMFDRKGALNTDGFEGSGADWLERYKPYIENGATVVSNPHKVFGPETNDLVLQMRKRGIDKVIIAGMSANLCTESHMRELQEQGFEVMVVSDATAAAQLPGLDGYAAAMTNFRMIASHVADTETTVEAMLAAAN